MSAPHHGPARAVDRQPPVAAAGNALAPLTRPTYRNSFYAHQRWQFSGRRLAQDAA